MAEAAISSIFSKLAPKLLEFIQNQELCKFWGVRKKLQRLEEKFSRVRSVINDAEARILAKPVEDWMDDLRGVAYDMGDILDEMNTERMRLERAASKEASNSHRVSRLLKVFNKLKKSPHYVAFNTKLNSKINNVLIKLDEITKDAHELGLKELRAASSLPYQPRLRPEETSFVDKSGVYGRLKEKEEIIELLLESDDSSQKKYSVIPIVGMGGIGKTTLARLVFEDKKVQDHFNWKSWACVSDIFDVAKVTKELIECVTKDDCSVTSLGGLQGKLRDMVLNKRCLFVLDDIWSVNEWERLEAPFHCCANGSRILVTTRDSNIAKGISNKEPYMLQKLEDEPCWDLFNEKAFRGVDAYTYAKLENIGKEIVGKCKGVPLAVKVLAGILQGATEEKWQSILRNELWQVATDNDSKIFPALRMSYYYLPSRLKCCFEYLSLFPTDYSLDKDELVRMWIAEGFVEGKEGRLPEDIASEYYDEMKGRTLIQNDNRMHDLVHGLACLVSRKFYCRLPKNTVSCKMGSIRHASFFNEPAKSTDLDLLLQAKSLRTLQGTYNDKDSYALWERLPKLSLLRVFSIQRADTAELPNCFSNLKHLRYLNLSHFGEIQNLPDSMCELYNLQTLGLQYCWSLNELPKDMGNLQRLRHLNLSHTSLSTLPSSICKLGDLLTLNLSGCRRLVEIPKDIGNLLGLRKFVLYYCGRLQHLPDSICKLHNLKVLNLINCESLCYLPEDIGGLQNIRELLLKSTKISSLPESICMLHNLEVLDLKDCTLLCYLPEDIGDLQNIRELLLKRTKISSLPESICMLHKVEVLDLGNCIRVTHLPKDVGNLGSLKRLNLNETKLRLPDSIVKISCLQELNIKCTIEGRQVKLPPHIGKLANLESSLNVYNVGKETGRGIDELKDMNKMRGKLVISHLENVESMEEALMADLKRKKHIEWLTLEWSPKNNEGCESSLVARDIEAEAKVLEALEPHPTHLTSLSIIRYSGDDLPKWMFLLRFSSLWRLHMEGLERISRVVGLELPSLTELEISKCPNLRDVSMAVPKLEELEVVDCQELTELSLLPFLHDDDYNSNFSWRIDLSQLSRVEICKCTNLRQVSMAVPKLKYLTLKDCRELNTILPMRQLEVYDHQEFIKPFLVEDSNSSCLSRIDLPELEELSIEQCPSLREVSTAAVPNLKTLKVVDCNMRSLLNLMNGLLLPLTLEYLVIRNCQQLEYLFEDGQELPKLQRLWIENCEQLRSLFKSEDGQELPKLQRLWIENCEQLSSSIFIPCGLAYLGVDYSYAQQQLLVAGGQVLLRNLTSLRGLQISDLPSAASFVLDHHDAFPPSLTDYIIRRCTDLTCLPKALHNHLPSITGLRLIECPQLVSFPERKEEVLPSTITTLGVSDCPQLVSLREEGLPPMLQELRITNCRNLEYLPKHLYNLASLHKLSLENCPQLELRPDDRLPPNLKKLYLFGDCSKLKQQLEEEYRRDWLDILS